MKDLNDVAKFLEKEGLESGLIKYKVEKRLHTIVDYDKTLKEMVEQSGCFHEYFRPESYSINRRGLSVEELLLIDFGRGMETAEVISVLIENDLRPANAVELLSFIDQHIRLIQDYVAIGALGSISDDLFVPFVRRGPIIRKWFFKTHSAPELWETDFEKGWSKHCRFLAVQDGKSLSCVDRERFKEGIDLTIGFHNAIANRTTWPMLDLQEKFKK